MTRVLFPLYSQKAADDFVYYRTAFRKEGFRLAEKESESLLLSSDAAVLYCDEEILSQPLTMSLLETAAERDIPLLLIHESGMNEELRKMIAQAEIIHASHIDFAQLRKRIDEGKKEPFADTHVPASSFRIPLWLMFLLTMAVMAFFLIRISVFSSGSSQQLSRQETIQKNVQDAVVRVYAIGSLSEESWRGCGFAVTKDGYIVTNAHVVDHASVRYKVIYREKDYNAQLICISDEQDIALLKISANTGSYLSLRSEDLLEEETLYAVGYPGNQKLTVLEGTALNRRITGSQNLVYEAIRMPLKQGISGSPVVDEKCRAVGIASAVSIADENLSYMVPADIAAEFLKEYIFLEEP